MVDFKASFLNTLKSVDDAFAKADKELHEIIAEASESLVEATDGKFELKLDLLEELLWGISYELLVCSEDESKDIGSYAIPYKGYPIKYGQWDYERRRIAGGTILEKKDSIATHLDNMINNPDSKLINYIFFKTRKSD